MCDRQESVAESMDVSTCLSSAVLRSTQALSVTCSQVFSNLPSCLSAVGDHLQAQELLSHTQPGGATNSWASSPIMSSPPGQSVKAQVTRAHLHFRKIRLHSWPQLSKSTRSSVQLVGFMSEPAIHISKAVSPATSSSLGS